MLLFLFIRKQIQMHFKIGTNESTYLYTPLVRDNFYFTASTVYYGMELLHLDTNTSKTFLLEDVSAAQDAFQKFQLTESSTQNLSAGTVDLKVGTHEYTFYPATAQTLSAIGTQILGRGFLEVTASTASAATYDSADSDVVIVYGE